MKKQIEALTDHEIDAFVKLWTAVEKYRWAITPNQKQKNWKAVCRLQDKLDKMKAYRNLGIE